MSLGNSKEVHSDQDEVSKNLQKILRRHIQNSYQKPIASHTAKATEALWPIIKKSTKPLILDCGCGTGESTLHLSSFHKDALIVGIDKSLKRIGKERLSESCYIIRADAIDFLLLSKVHNVSFAKIYLLYPNPWPKASHIKRRWHGHPIFPILIDSCQQIELRTNWDIYAKEFQSALRELGKRTKLQSVPIDTFPISPFERKYKLSGHELFTVSTP